MLLLALLVLGMTPFVQAQVKAKVAVYVSGEIDGACKKIISSKAVSRISRSTEYAAVERTEAFLGVLTKEQDFQLSGEVRDDQIAALGKRFGARYVAAFDVTADADDSGFISARMIDVESGLVVKSADTGRKIKSSEDWIALVNNVAYRLVTPKSN